ncbi:sensor histidine kinase [Histidinibacterium aquaticum]|uniref:histidine kinase n=1 Tax=Histidinibacterium aquaticum TaxID=2613962 RepID=A0A5J5GI13_9RHOB|nr:sensor histidine kinase [Histidinibacterium aquaticum]KAA9007795.1 sensor histidine kinase [Histidinibacterium aquaticum]
MADPEPPALILAPLGGDARALAKVIESTGTPSRTVADAAEFKAAVEEFGLENVLFVLVSQEGATQALGEALHRIAETEPDWSRLPTLFLIDDIKRPPPGYRILAAVEDTSSRIVLERPVAPAILRRIARTMAASRARQFRTKNLLDQLRREEERSAFLLRELRHRVRNSLAVMQSLFKMTARRAESVEELAESFGTRLRNLSDAHLRLAGSGEGAPTLQELVSDQVLPYAGERDRLDISGPEVWLSDKIAFDLALVIHELATNASKYGALSNETGRIEVDWTTDTETGELVLSWRERGGPSVSPPERRGLGSSLISSFLADGENKPETRYEPEGLVWTAHIPESDYWTSEPTAPGRLQESAHQDREPS